MPKWQLNEVGSCTRNASNTAKSASSLSAKEMKTLVLKGIKVKNTNLEMTEKNGEIRILRALLRLRKKRKK